MNKQIEPDPFFIQQATFVMSDLLESGLMFEINRHFSSTGPQIIFNLNRYATVLKSQGAKSLIKTKSNSRSPIRLIDQQQQQQQRQRSVR